MPEETVTELHLSPPCYGNVALDPHCVALHHVFTMSGVPFNAVAEAANGTVVPHLVVFGDTLSGEVHLNEVQGVTPSESFDKVVAFAKSCGIPHGPVHVHETLRPRQKAQAASLRIYLEATLLPPLCWARATKHRALHRAQLSQHTGLLSRLLWRRAHSFTEAERLLKTQAKASIAYDSDAVVLALEGFTAVETLLKASTTGWLLNASLPSLLDVLVASILQCYEGQPMLAHELNQHPTLIAWKDKVLSLGAGGKRHELRPLTTVEAEHDPYSSGRTAAVLVMSSIFLAYCTARSELLRSGFAALRALSPASLAAAAGRLPRLALKSS
eukprot:Rhum_TRINITY_DN14305_c23_g1::Rhum_TRINITY_DN14305_c23_g1_i1::g.80279::m.80279